MAWTIVNSNENYTQGKVSVSVGVKKSTMVETTSMIRDIEQNRK